MAPDRRRRVVARDAERHGQAHARVDHHRRALQQVRPTHGRRVRRGGHRLRRSHGRDDVHPRQHRSVPRAGRRQRCQDRSFLRIRLHPFGSHGVCAVQAGAAGRCGPARRHHVRDARDGRWSVGRHRRFDDGGLRPGVGGPGHSSRDERPLHPDNRPGRRTRSWPSVRHPVAARPGRCPRARRHLGRCLRDGERRTRESCAAATLCSTGRTAAPFGTPRR